MKVKVKNKIKRMQRRSGIVFELLLLMIVMAICFMNAPEDNKTAFDSEDVCRITEPVKVSVNGTDTEECVLPAAADVHAGDTILIAKELDADTVTGDAVMFYVQQARVKIWLDDELLWKDQEWDVPFPMLEGIYWRIARLPADYEGRTLRIEIVPQLDKYTDELPVIYTGTKAALIFMALREGALFLFIGIATFVLGVVMFLAGILLRKEGAIAARLYYLGLLSMLIGIWGSLEARVTQLFTGNIPRASFVVFGCFAMFPILITAFVLTYDSLRDRWYMKALFCISVVDFLLQQLFQITGIFYYREMVDVVQILFVLIMAGLIAGFVEMVRDPDSVKEYYIYKALLMLAVFGLADIIWYFCGETKHIGVFLRTGILGFIAYLGYDAVRQIGILRVQEAKYSTYKELAFTDIMTGLDNRTSFEHTMGIIRGQQGAGNGSGQERWMIMMVDMNCLKLINDEYGHDRGDEAIFRLASNLKKYFGLIGECFRIGGDEFCVLAKGVSAEQFEQICTEFHAAIAEEAKGLVYPFSASSGYVPLDESGVDECLKRADAKMYEEKKRSGKIRGK